jgi:hypothetical protein
MKLKNFSDFNESHGTNVLLYYSFDFDDNILHMPTKILMDKKLNGEWIPVEVSTTKFAEVRSLEDYRIRNNDPNQAFSEFRDTGKRGDKAFIIDVTESINNKNYGPVWNDFIECVTNGSLFSIITARGHESPTIRKGVEWILNNCLSDDQKQDMYSNLLKFKYLFKDGDNIDEFDRILKDKKLTDNRLVKKYLDNCDFVGISAPSLGYDASNPEKAKEIALLKFKNKVNNFAGSIGWKAKIGFSDDDIKNVKHVEELFDTIDNEEFVHIIEWVVKGTKKDNFTKKVRKVDEATFTNQAPGMASSIQSFQQYNNMTTRYYPQDGDKDPQSHLIKIKSKHISKIMDDIKDDLDEDDLDEEDLDTLGN